MGFLWNLGLYFELGKAFYAVQWSLSPYPIGIQFSRWLRVLPVLAVCSGGRRWDAVLQRHKTVPKLRKKHYWEEGEKQSLFKNPQVAKKSDAVPRKVRKGHVQSSWNNCSFVLCSYLDVKCKHTALFLALRKPKQNASGSCYLFCLE